MVDAVIEIGQGEFTFCAAHAGLHDTGFEPLHGHTFQVTVRLAGSCDPITGMVCDFGPVKAALREVIRPLKRRTLVATATDPATVETHGDSVWVSDGIRSWSFPADDVVLLPLANTSTEELAGYLLGQLGPRLPTGRLAWVEVSLSEAPDASATVRMDLR
jgi:6-pyruvoyl-tetrahydropterin synthase